MIHFWHSFIAADWWKKSKSVFVISFWREQKHSKQISLNLFPAVFCINYWLDHSHKKNQSIYKLKSVLMKISWKGNKLFFAVYSQQKWYFPSQKTSIHRNPWGIKVLIHPNQNVTSPAIAFFIFLIKIESPKHMYLCILMGK